MRFKKGDLEKQILSRGLSQRGFADLAGVSTNTLRKACRGEKLTKLTWGKILIGLKRTTPLMASQRSREAV
jgi:hypothetical protein